MESLIRVLKHRKKFIIVFALVVAVLAAGLSFLFPLKYSASVRLLITQKAGFTLDPYTALRSSELVGENLAQVVSTSSFLDRVLGTNYNINHSYFDLAELQRRRLWTKTISASQVRGSGMLDITAYHPDKQEALKIVAASSFLLSTQGSDYIGRDITVRLVDPPLASRFPVQPNIPLNFIAGGILGAVLSSAYVWTEHRKKKHHGEMIG